MTRSNKDHLAKRIKAIRKSKSMTLSEVEAICGVTASTISKIENNTLSPTYANLLRLAKGLGVDIVELVSESSTKNARTRLSISRKDEGVTHTIGTHDYQVLCTNLKDKKMLPMIATIKANEVSDLSDLLVNNNSSYFSHEGEEVLFVVSGEIQFLTEHYEPINLYQGDCAYIDSTMGHICLKASEEEAVIFWVCSDKSSLELLETLTKQNHQ